MNSDVKISRHLIYEFNVPVVIILICTCKIFDTIWYKPIYVKDVDFSAN